jgi:hypothetical protein
MELSKSPHERRPISEVSPGEKRAGMEDSGASGERRSQRCCKKLRRATIV